MLEPSPEINAVSPTALDELIGQRQAVEQVRIALAAARNDHTTFPATLATGPPGCGKTQTAKVIAAEMGTGYHEILGQAIQNPVDLNALLLGASDRDVILLDEAHELEKEYQTALYLALDQRRIILNGSRSGRTPQSIPIPDATIILATTDEFRLMAPLRDRCRLLLRFTFYSEEDLELLLTRRSEALGWKVQNKVFKNIALRSRGTPRLALRLLQSCRRVCRAEGQDTITQAHFDRASLLEQIDAVGLGPVEQQYLRLLAEGGSRLNVISSRLGLPSRTVAEVTEPFLLRTGLIDKDDQGRRQLTALAREHLNHSSNTIR